MWDGTKVQFWFWLADWNLTVSSVIHEVVFEPFVEAPGRTGCVGLCWWSSFFFHSPWCSSLLLSFEVFIGTQALIGMCPYHPGMYLKQGLGFSPKILPKGLGVFKQVSKWEEKKCLKGLIFDTDFPWNIRIVYLKVLMYLILYQTRLSDVASCIYQDLTEICRLLT